MRAAPAFQISLNRFGIWRAGILGLSVLGIAVLALWLAGRERVPWVDALTGLSILPLVVLARSLARVPPVDLSWDGRAWSLRPEGQPIDSAQVGDLQVVVDLGPWMLLRFRAEGAGSTRPIWLPVQVLGIAAQWHALRCAVHAPRPLPVADAAASE
jgi:hypothetical protein